MKCSSLQLSLAAKALLVVQFLCAFLSPVLSSVCFNADSYKNASGFWNVEAVITHKDTGIRDREFGLGLQRWNYNVEVSTLENDYSDSIQVVFKTAAPPRRVGSDYTLYPGFGYYKHYDEWAEWHEAKKICEREGAHLMIINSKEEAEVFKKVLKNIKKGQYWVHIGFHDRFQEGEYTTVLGTTLSSTGYTAWLPGMPVEDDDDHCGAADVATGELMDVNCNDGAQFICEQELW